MGEEEVSKGGFFPGHPGQPDPSGALRQELHQSLSCCETRSQAFFSNPCVVGLWPCAAPGVGAVTP